MNRLTVIVSAAFFALGLTACGGSKQVDALESLLTGAESDIKTCEQKKGAELADCVSKRLEKLGNDWGKQVTAAGEEDPEATAELAKRYTTLSAKAAELVSSAYN